MFEYRGGATGAQATSPRFTARAFLSGYGAENRETVFGRLRAISLILAPDSVFTSARPIGRNAYRVVIHGRSKERRDTAQTQGSMP
jgi:hypothetical protein